MAAAAAAALLDELMGRDRNLAPTEKKSELRWNDHQVCKHYLVMFCPNELFINTRADLGPCDKLHDDFLKREYEKSVSYQRMGYEDDFIKFCQGMLSDVERRIRRGKQRLSLGTQEGGIPTPTQVKNNDEQIKMLTERVNGLLEQVESLGCEGKVEEAQGIMKLCDQLKEERENLRKANENSHWYQTAEIAAAQEKQMEVCEVCGAFLIVGDAQQRVDDHLMGKQHVGYAKIKAGLEEILDKRQKEKEEREKMREKEREDRMSKRKEFEKTRDKEAEDRRKKRDDDRRKDRKRSRSRSRDHKRSRSQDRKKSRSKSKERKRSRSRTRSHRHSHGRDRKHSRSRSRGRDRDHKKSRRSRSRSRSKERRRSRDRRKEKDHNNHESKHNSKDDGKDTNSRTEHASSKAENHVSKSKDKRNSDESDGGNAEGNDGALDDTETSDWVARMMSSAAVATTPTTTAVTDGESNGAKCEGDSEQ